MKKLLITGFDPFGGESVNPAYEAVRLLPDVVAGIKLCKLEAPTEFVRSGAVLRDALAAENAFDAPVYALARQFRAADAVAVAAPFWDLSYPAALRTYIEYISANGLTYHYDEAGCHGDCGAKHLVYLTSGGDVEREDSAGVLHWRQLSDMFGIPQFDYVFAGGLDARPETAEETLTAACRLAAALAETL